MKFIKIKSIRKWKRQETIDIETKNNHDFILSNGVLSHNSRRSMSSDNVDFSKFLTIQRHTGCPMITSQQTIAMCLPKNTRIITDRGNQKLINMNVREMALSWNQKKNCTEFQEVTAKKESLAECYEIELENGEIIRCSENHKWPTAEGIIKTKFLTTSHHIYKLKNS